MHHRPTSRVASRHGLRATVLAGGLSLALMALLAACGATSSTQTFPTATDIPATPGTAQLNGCPAQQAPATAKTADVVIQGNAAPTQADPQPVTAKSGQTVEIDLPATYRWALVQDGDSTLLTAPDTNGWFDTSGKGCIWQFTATKAGSSTLTFAGAQVCSSASKCPNLTTNQSFAVTVS